MCIVGTSGVKALVYFPSAQPSPRNAWMPSPRGPQRALTTNDKHLSFSEFSIMNTYLEFAGNHVLLVSALMVSFFVVVFTELQRKARGVTSIEPQDAIKLINADAVVIDLRNAEAFSQGHIVNAKNIPHDELDTEMEKLERFKSKPIVAVCDAGMTSGKLVNTLRKSGMENVYGLRGGISAWTQANLPLVAAKKTKSKS